MNKTRHSQSGIEVFSVKTQKREVKANLGLELAFCRREVKKITSKRQDWPGEVGISGVINSKWHWTFGERTEFRRQAILGLYIICPKARLIFKNLTEVWGDRQFCQIFSRKEVFSGNP